MRLPHTPRTQRTGFTLIELLVVIAIIAILVGLTASGVMKIMWKGPELQTRHDITQLATAVNDFKLKFGVDYMPSRIRLKRVLTIGTNPGDYNLAVPLDRDSVTYIRKLWPRCEKQWMVGPDGMPGTGDEGIDWGPAGWSGDATLEGYECLVWFLGGQQISNPVGVNGFSSNPNNPMPAAGTPGDVRPFADFKTQRLMVTSAPMFPANNNFLCYRDPYNVPYAYFSSYKTRNGYDRYPNAANPQMIQDCISINVFPYREAPRPVPALAGGRFLNPETFQIISAGADKKFGMGDTVLPATGNGDDDLSNFHPRTLGH